MVTEIRQLDPVSMLWNSWGTIYPGEHKTIVQNLPEGDRCLYVIGCNQDNTRSFINKAPYKPSLIVSEGQFLGGRADLTFVRELKRGEEYIVTMRHDGSKVGRFMKFTHK